MPPYLSKYNNQLTNYITNLISSEKNKQSHHGTWSQELFDAFLPLAVSGKMIRGSLVLYTAELLTELNSNPLVPLAAFVELVHLSLLIHDDIIDNDSLRRNLPTLHTTFGLPTGIIAGDLSYFLGYKALGDATGTIKNLGKVLELSGKEFSNVCFGELHDMFAAEAHTLPNEKEVLDIYLFKTARYTFSLPLMLAGLAVDAQDETIQRLEELGECLGLMFQLVDDRIGMFGSTNTIGKPAGSDIRENKKTFYYVLLMNTASDKAKHKLSEIFGNPKLTQEDITFVRDTIQSLSIDKKIQSMIDTYSANSREIIKSLPISAKRRIELEELVTYLSGRES